MEKRAKVVTALLAGIVAGLSAAILLMRSRRGSEKPSKAAAPAPDPILTDVKGIGPVYSDRLKKAKVRTLDDLIEAGAEAAAAATGVAEEAAADWIRQAKALSDSG